MVAGVAIWDGDTITSGTYLSNGTVQFTVQYNMQRHHLLNQLKSVNISYVQRITAQLTAQEL